MWQQKMEIYQNQQIESTESEGVSVKFTCKHSEILSLYELT